MIHTMEKEDFCIPNRKEHVVISLTVLVFLVITALPISQLYASSANPGVYPINSSPFGKPYDEWIANWWNYNVQIDAEKHPRDNFSPELCNLDQSQEDAVLYLPDNLSGEEIRSCTLPAEKAILAPQITGSCWAEPNLLECAREGNEFGVVSATIDGVELQNLEQYRVTSDVFNMTVPENNAFESPSGTFPAIADGYFVFLEPLPAGEHTLVLEQSVINPVRPEYNFASETTYLLTVEP